MALGRLVLVSSQCRVANVIFMGHQIETCLIEEDISILLMQLNDTLMSS